MNWLAIVGGVVGPGGIAYGLITWLTGRRKGKVDNAVALNTSTLSYATELRKDLEERDKRDEQRDARIDTLEARLNAQAALAMRHMPWDWKVYRALADLGHPVDEPPPLLPVDQH